MPKTVLIVDDNLMNRRLFSVLLHKAGYETLEAEDGVAGVAMTKAALPDLVLMDVQMPVMDGTDAMKVLRSDDATKSIPVIATTSYAMKGDRERFLSEGFIDYISKPIDSEAFLQTVKTTLERYHG